MALAVMLTAAYCCMWLASVMSCMISNAVIFMMHPLGLSKHSMFIPCGLAHRDALEPVMVCQPTHKHPVGDWLALTRC